MDYPQERIDTIEQSASNAITSSSKPKTNKGIVMKLSDYQPSLSNYIIDDLKISAGVFLITGNYSSYKTTLCVRFGMMLAAGYKQVLKGIDQTTFVTHNPDVLWLDFESSSNKILEIMKLWADNLGLEQQHIDGFSYLNHHDYQYDLDELVKKYKVIFIDNLESLAHEVWGIDVYQPEIGARIRKLRHLAQKNNSLIIIIRHGSKSDMNQDRGKARGAGSASISNAVNDDWFFETDKKDRSKIIAKQSKPSGEYCPDWKINVYRNKAGINMTACLNDSKDSEEEDKNKIIQALTISPGQSVRKLSLATGLSRTDRLPNLLAELESEGKVKHEKTTWSIV